MLFSLIMSAVWVCALRAQPINCCYFLCVSRSSDKFALAQLQKILVSQKPPQANNIYTHIMYIIELHDKFLWFLTKPRRSHCLAFCMHAYSNYILYVACLLLFRSISNAFARKYEPWPGIVSIDELYP